MASTLLKERYTKVWIDDNGVNKYCPNMATVITNPVFRVGGCPHLFGDIVLEVRVKDFMNLQFNSNTLRLHDKCINKDADDEEWYGKFDGYEPEDDADIEKTVKWCKENDYDWIEEYGMIYLAKC
jgi:hypothetical protein